MRRDAGFLREKVYPSVLKADIRRPVQARHAFASVCLHSHPYQPLEEIRSCTND